MNQLLAVAFGGALGAGLRFLISTGVYQWLGRGFPYGTLAVNIIGSFLVGLMTETLVLQRAALSLEYRLAILVGLFGSLTTFSTFSLDSLHLIEQGQFVKASLNIFSSVFICIFAVWLGLTLGKAIFFYADGVIHWQGFIFPYALLIVNTIGAFLLGFVSTLLLSKVSLSAEYNATLLIIFTGVFITLSSLYLVLYLPEHEHSFVTHIKSISALVISNIVVCSLALCFGFLVAKQI